MQHNMSLNFRCKEGITQLEQTMSVDDVEWRLRHEARELNSFQYSCALNKRSGVCIIC